MAASPAQHKTKKLQRSSEDSLSANEKATNDTFSCQSTDAEGSTDEAEFTRRYSLESTGTSISTATVEASKMRVKAMNAAHPARAKGNRREVKNPPTRCGFGADVASLQNPPRGAAGNAGLGMLSRLRKQGQSVLRDIKLEDQSKTMTELHASKAAVMAPPGLEPKQPTEWLPLGGEPMHIRLPSTTSLMSEALPRGLPSSNQEMRRWAKCPPGLEATLVATKGPPGMF